MQPLLKVFAQGGILMLPMVLIVLVLVGIVLRALWHLYVRGGSDAAAIQSCLDSLLFWGGFAVVIGVLGSAIGYHKVISVVVGPRHPQPQGAVDRHGRGNGLDDCRSARAGGRRCGLVPAPVAAPQKPPPGAVILQSRSPIKHLGRRLVREAFTP